MSILRNKPSAEIEASSGYGLSAESNANRGRGSTPRHLENSLRRSDSPSRSGDKEDKPNLKCSHCGKKKHMKETCFLLVGYPDWWNSRSPTTGEAREAIGKEAAAMETPKDTSSSTQQRPEEGTSLLYLSGSEECKKKSHRRDRNRKLQ